MIGFTHVHLPLVSDYSQVLRAQQDSLMSITCTTVFTHEYSVLTHEYKSAQQEIFVSIFNSSALYFSCRTSPTHKLSSNFLKARSVTRIFCKLRHELYWSYIILTSNKHFHENFMHVAAAMPLQRICNRNYGREQKS